MRFFTSHYPILFLFIVGMLLPNCHNAQSLISKFDFDDCEFESEIYPYEWFDFSRGFFGPVHESALRISESEFVYLTLPKSSYRERALTCFNLLLEEQWSTEIQLEFEEEVFHIYKHNGHIYVLSKHFNYNGKTHLVKARKYQTNSGKLTGRKDIYLVKGPKNFPVGFDFSPDNQRFIIYHFERYSEKRRMREFYDYVMGEETLGYRISNIGKVHFTSFDLSLSPQASSAMPLDITLKEQAFTVDCQVDNAGKVYVTSWKFPSLLSIIQFDPEKKSQKILTYKDFPNPWSQSEPYGVKLPPTLGNNGRAYLCYSVREKVKRKWHTNGFQIVTFDFDSMSIDLKRQVSIRSSFLVEVAKSREEAGMKPDVIFDRHLMKDIFELPDGRVWLLTQKYERGQLGYPNMVTGGTTGFASRAEEIILFEFEPEGRIQRAMILPLVQKATNAKELAGRFYHLQLHQETAEIDLITREYSGRKHRHPPRIFHRKIDLNEGLVTDRKLLYEGRRREQYLINAYTVWLNPSVAVMMILDGDTEKKPDIVSVKVVD